MKNKYKHQRQLCIATGVLLFAVSFYFVPKRQSQSQKEANKLLETSEKLLSKSRPDDNNKKEKQQIPVSIHLSFKAVDTDNKPEE